MTVIGEEAKTYTGLPRTHSYGGRRLTPDEMEALRKRAFANVADVRANAGARRVRAEQAKAARQAAKADERLWKTSVRNALREAKAELKGVKAVCRDYARRERAGTLTRREAGLWDEADATLENLTDRVGDLREMLRKGY